MRILDNEITIENKTMFDEYLERCKYKTSSLSFTALNMWKDVNEYSWQNIGEYLCIAGVSHIDTKEGTKPYMFYPLSKDGKYDTKELRKTILKCKEIFEQKGFEFILRKVPFGILNEILKSFPEEFEFLDDRANYDYLHSKTDLIELQGKDFQAKRNNIKHFERAHRFKYVKIDETLNDDISEFLDRWFEVRKSEMPEIENFIKNEENTMRNVFSNYKAAEYVGGVIYVDGKVEAISVGGISSKDTVTVHIEKANRDMRGLYQVINREFCKHMPQSIRYVNREDDMGMLYMRRTKLSYKPIEMIEKYIVKIN